MDKTGRVDYKELRGQDGFWLDCGSSSRSSGGGSSSRGQVCQQLFDCDWQVLNL
jgi:hypothetical protein